MIGTDDRSEDVTIPVPGGPELRARFWKARAPRGVVVVSHGLGEHGGCYAHVADVLNHGPAPVDVLAFDYRGHGRSPGPRGMVRRYEDLLADLRAAMAWAARERPGLPRFVLGHSNGGHVALRLVLAGEPDLAGLILSNPTLRLAFPVPRHKLVLAHVLLRVAPGVTLGSEVDHSLMTRDTSDHAARSADPLRHNRINAALFFGMVGYADEFLRRADSIRVPLLILLGQSDPVVDPQPTMELFERLGSPDKTLRLYPESLHEPLNDLDRDAVLADLVAWLSERLPGPS